MGRRGTAAPRRPWYSLWKIRVGGDADLVSGPSTEGSSVASSQGIDTVFAELVRC